MTLSHHRLTPLLFGVQDFFFKVKVIASYQSIQETALAHAVNDAMRLAAKQRLTSARIGTCIHFLLYFVRNAQPRRFARS